MTHPLAPPSGFRLLPRSLMVASLVWPIALMAQPATPPTSAPDDRAIGKQQGGRDEVLIPASHAQAIEKAAQAVSRCIAIQQDAARLRCYDQVPMVSLDARAGTGATRAAGQAATIAPGKRVPIPAGQAEDLWRASRRTAECRAMSVDADRLHCYDELVASRITPPDRSLPSGTAHQYGLKLKAPEAQSHAESHEQRPAQQGSWFSGDAWFRDALPSFEPSPPDEARFLLDGRQASRAVQDVRRSLGADLTDRWELDDTTSRGRFVLRPYKPMYVIFGDWSSRVNRAPSTPNPDNAWATASAADVANTGLLKNVEAKFQISLKTKIYENLIGDNGDIWIGYTQVSLWQIYTPSMSRPFRETNYEPEVMAVFRTHRKVGHWHWRLASIGLNHQSNGRGLPMSRSWNRIIMQFGLEREGWMMMLRPWVRVPEEAQDDDNPDISDYMGRGELLLVHRRGGHEMSLTARHSLRLGSRSRGSLGFDYAFPISSYLKAHLQVFRGYGASMIDYNHKQTRVGLGISLVQWL